MADLSNLSDDQLKQLYAITKIESRGAPDTSTIQSPKGAMGSMQVMPGTAASPGFGIAPSNGTPEDTARVGHDYYLALQDKYKDPTTAAIAYNMGPGATDKWIANGSNFDQLPDETLVYAHKFNQLTSQPQQSPQPQSDPYANLSDEELTKLYLSQQKPRGQQALENLVSQGKANISATGAGMTGVGEAYTNIATGGLGMITGGLASLVDLATGRSANATSDLANIEKALTYQPRTEEGKQIQQKVAEGYNKILTAAQSGVGKVTGALGVPKEVSDTAVEVLANIGPMLLGLKGPVKGGAEGIKVPESAGEMDKLQTATESNAPTAPPAPPTVPQVPGEEFGPERPPISVNAAGEAINPLQNVPPEIIQAEQLARQRQLSAEQQAAGTLFPGEDLGMASPYNPNRLSPEFMPTEVTDNLQPRNLRQGELNLQQGNIPDRLIVSPEGETMTESQALVRQQFGDTMAARTADLLKQTPEQLDMFNPIDQRRFDQFGENEVPRTLDRNEFESTVTNLAAKDGTRFPLPEDMEKAYGRYLESTRDDQGGLFDRPTMAKKFADAALDEAVERRVNDNPAVKAANTKVTQLESLLANATDSQTRLATQNALLEARKTLDKAQENIRKVFEPAAKVTAPWEANGQVNMFTFGHLPEMFKSIGAILKGIHGVTFNLLDKAVPNFRNLDSGPKIFAQGVKNFISREANRDWSQTINEKPKEILGKMPGLREGINEYNPFSAQGITKDELRAQINATPDIPNGLSSKIAQNVVAGGLQLTNLTRHPLIKYVTEQVDQASRLSRAYVRDRLTGPQGLRTKLQALTEDELTGIWNLRMMNEGVREFSDNELKNAGYTPKQIEWYKQSVQEQKDAFVKHNAARQSAGLKPMDERIGHLAGYFMGDFKRLVLNKDDHVVAVIAHNTKRGVDTLTQRFMETHGEDGLKTTPVQLNRLKEGSGVADNRFTGYMEILNTIGENNPYMQSVLDAYKDMSTRDAQTAMNNRAKFKTKEGVIGAEGKKSWVSAKQNALDGARQQLMYLEAVDKWANMQKAVQDTRDVIADPETQAPNAKARAQDYLDSVQGRNRGSVQNVTNGLMNAWANVTGIGPSVWKGFNNAQKSALLMKFVGIGKLSHSAVTMIQPLQAILPINMRLAARGADLGSASVASVAKAASSCFNITARELQGKALSGFDQRAFDFMQTNGTTDVGMSSHLRNITSTSATMERIRNIGEMNVKIPEHAARQFTFMYAAHMLRDLSEKYSGEPGAKPLSEAEIFGTAHNFMRDVMVDYNPHESPLMFGKMGILGDIASTLTRFKYNQIGQHLIGAADIFRGGSAAPLAATIMTSIVTGGLRGVFAYEAANQLVDQISTLMAKNGLIKQPTSLNEMILHMLHGTNQTFSDLVNFGAPAALGVNMTGSLTNADSIPTDPLGALFPTASEFKSMGESAYKLAAHHNIQAAKQFAYEMSPNSLKGVEENMMFTKPGGKFMNPRNPTQLETTRSPSDEVKRALSFRPLNEAREGFVASTANRKTEQLNEAKSAVVQKALSDLGSSPTGKLTTDQVQSYAKRYVELGGDPDAFVKQLVDAMGMEQQRNKLQRAEGIPSNDLSSINKYLRAKGME